MTINKLLASVIFIGLIIWASLDQLDGIYYLAISSGMLVAFLLFYFILLMQSSSLKKKNEDLKKNLKSAGKWFIALSIFNGMIYAAINHLNSTRDCIQFYKLGEIVKFVECIKVGARAGNSVKQASLAVSYYNGEIVEKNYGKALKWAKLSADSGNAVAFNLLGVIYEEGKVLNQDYQEAFKWYKRAADNGLPLGIANMGRLIYNGLGVERDTIKGKTLLEEAISKGLVEAEQTLLEIQKLENSGN